MGTTTSTGAAPTAALLLALGLGFGLACATSRGAGLGADGDGCRAHGDCGPGLLCGDEEDRCLEDECVSDDDCDAAKLGQARCTVVDGAPAVERCDYDGYRCLEWAAEACAPTATCVEGGEDGPACLGPDGRPVAEPEESNAPEDEDQAAGP